MNAVVIQCKQTSLCNRRHFGIAFQHCCLHHPREEPRQHRSQILSSTRAGQTYGSSTGAKVQLSDAKSWISAFRKKYPTYCQEPCLNSKVLCLLWTRTESTGAAECGGATLRGLRNVQHGQEISVGSPPSPQRILNAERK